MLKKIIIGVVGIVLITFGVAFATTGAELFDLLIKNIKAIGDTRIALLDLLEANNKDDVPAARIIISQLHDNVTEYANTCEKLAEFRIQSNCARDFDSFLGSIDEARLSLADFLMKHKMYKEAEGEYRFVVQSASGYGPTNFYAEKARFALEDLKKIKKVKK